MTNKEINVLLFSGGLSPKIGLRRVFVDGVLQYKAKRWMYFLPKWAVKIIKRLDD